jgi:hypothetical protein
MSSIVRNAILESAHGLSDLGWGAVSGKIEVVLTLIVSRVSEERLPHWPLPVV